MKTRIVSATEFKAKCLALLYEIEERGGAITITRRGRPVAVLGPAKKKAFKSSRDSLAGKAKIVGDIVNLDTSDLWDVTRGESSEDIPMLPRFLLDTHVAIRWLIESKKLTQEQTSHLRSGDRGCFATPFASPADRAIVATARVHRLSLVTSDQHIIE
jgi:prevent-host-death family protein